MKSIGTMFIGYSFGIMDFGTREEWGFGIGTFILGVLVICVDLLFDKYVEKKDAEAKSEVKEE